MKDKNLNDTLLDRYNQQKSNYYLQFKRLTDCIENSVLSGSYIGDVFMERIPEEQEKIFIDETGLLLEYQHIYGFYRVSLNMENK